MIPVEQTIFSPPSGNCFSACVASIMEKPLWTVPNFAVHCKPGSRKHARIYGEKIHRWLKKQEWTILDFRVEGRGETWGVSALPKGFPAILTIPSPRSNFDELLHCVVADFSTGELLHDPLPRSLGPLPVGEALELQPVSWEILLPWKLTRELVR